MNPGDDNHDFERELLEMELRRPPAEWKALVLPTPVMPWFSKPFLIFHGCAWAVIGGLILTTPKNEIPGPPLILPPPPPLPPDLLGFNSNSEFHQ